MLLSIIVTHYKTPDLLMLCLRSLKEATADLECEIIVLDSESREETGEMIKSEWPAIKFLPFEKNTGYAKIVNAGLREAEGDFLLVLNADIITEKKSVKEMVEYMSANKDIGALGPRLLNFDGTIQESCFRFHRPMTIVYRRTFLSKLSSGRKEIDRFAMKDFDRQEVRVVDWLLGAALMLRREAIDDAGIMDERFFLYFEDTDWCRRFKQKSWKVVYFPPAKMHHYHSRLSKKAGVLADLFFNKYTWIHIASAIKYFWKWRGKQLTINN